MDGYLVIVDDLKNFHMDTKVLVIAILSYLALYVLLAVLTNYIYKKRYNKLSKFGFIPILQNYTAGLLSFNGYVGVMLVFIPFFAFVSQYYFSQEVCKFLYLFCIIFYLIAFVRLIVIAYNLSLNKATIDENGLISNDFIVTITDDELSGEKVISIKDVNDN